MINIASHAFVELIGAKIDARIDTKPVALESTNAKPAKSGLAFLLSPSFTLGALLLTPLFSVSSPVYAQIEVVEAEPAVITDSRYPQARPSETIPAASTSKNTMNDAPPPIASDSGNAGLFVQLQDLQAEVRELRGLVEQQNYVIEQLSQKRMDDYLDLDRRIGELTVSASSAASATQPLQNSANGSSKPNNPSIKNVPVKRYSTAKAAPSTASVIAVAAAVPPAASEAEVAKKAYRAAYQKVKDREFDQARVSLAAFISAHPKSHYIPNAHFWLGELYYLESNLPKSKQSFNALITQYPSHRKIADAKFKLGKVYHQLGDNNAARSMLESVLSDHPGSTAANPAREYLNNSLR